MFIWNMGQVISGYSENQSWHMYSEGAEHKQDKHIT